MKPLSEELELWRAERPSEFKMDDFIWAAQRLEKEVDRLKHEASYAVKTGMDNWLKVTEERDELKADYALLAQELVYEGNSVQHWAHKAKAYKECAGAIYELKKLLGVETPSDVLRRVQQLHDNKE